MRDALFLDIGVRRAAPRVAHMVAPMASFCHNAAPRGSPDRL